MSAPKRSQNLPSALERERYSATIDLAVSTGSRDTPESGTGTATHLLLSLKATRFCFLYTLPSGPASETCILLVARRLNHHTPYCFSGSSRTATSGETSSFTSSKA